MHPRFDLILGILKGILDLDSIFDMNLSSLSDFHSFFFLLKLEASITEAVSHLPDYFIVENIVSICKITMQNTNVGGCYG